MPKSTAARKPTLIHPVSTSRIARASVALMGPLTADATLTDDVILAALQTSIERFGVRPLIKALESHKTELMGRLVAMVRREGEADDEGTIRYETEQHKFTVIKGENVYIGEKALRTAMTSAGMTPKQQEKVLKPALKRTPYEYVGVYRKASADAATEVE